MNSRLKAGLLGLLNHRDPAIAARARKDLAKSDDPAERALVNTARDRFSGLLDGPRRAGRVAKSTSNPESNSTRRVAGQGKVDRPGTYDFTHLAHASQQLAAVKTAATAPASPSADAVARRMLAVAGIAVASSGSPATSWKPATPKTYPSADAAARASLAAAGIAVPKPEHLNYEA